MPTAQDSAQSAPQAPSKTIRQNVRKKRTAVSCDRCKNRKTKCVEPVPGPCQYCASINAPCKTDLNRRKKRPYYHVSEEEYRCMTEILRHYLPDLQFNLPSLKALCQRLESLSGSSAAGIPEDHDTPETPAEEEEEEEKEAEQEDGRPIAAAEGNEESPTIQEIQALQEQLGCLMIDSRGNYRHVGLDSSIGFNAAVRMIKRDRVEEKADKDIIQPLTTTSLPPQTPESSVGLEHQDHIYLPPQEHASAYSQRYFDEVHCLYWLFSTEQFHERVHETYVTGGVIASASWLCCLYSIFAIGSAGAEIPGQKRSTEFLVMAKALVPQVNDEADVDSIRALCLLALALQVECHTNAAYLYIGTAVRTAYSLGLHVEKAPPSRGRLEREQNRRIWWTLYLLDYEIAHRYGNPCAVLDGTHPNQVQMPSEQILGPGPNTPPGYLAAASSLCRLSRRIRANLHNPVPTSSPTSSSAAVPPTTPTISLATIQSLLSSMQDWLSSLPPHLSALAHTAPSHRRAVGILHLNYWAHVVLITRPFLLYTVLHHWEQQHSSSGTATATAALTGDKKRRFDQLGATCVSAAEQALGIMRTMSQQQSLSSIVNFDCSCLLEMVQIFRLALVMEKATEGGGAVEGKRAMAQIVECVGILRGMEFVGWTSQALPELEVQLRDCAIFNADGDDQFTFGREVAASAGVNTEGMEVEDTLGAFFGDVLGEGSAAGGAFGDNYNNLLFLEIDFT